MTMQLPASLQAWHPWLSWFAPELAAEIGDLLRRMHPLLGRFQGRRQGGVPEPDGVEDLRRRGSYERLLSSEWLLASELPDEFLRRAASGEHLFLAPRPRARQADRLIVAVFDAGPWQLGAPRLAQLALWILLARRAAEAGGELRWGVFQRPGQWHEAGTPDHLKEMLRARSFESAGVAQWQQWSAWLAEHAPGIGECWLVGHAVDATHQLADPPTHTLRVRQSLAGASLELALRAAGSAPRAMQLPLPEPRPAAQLLQGRFQSEAVSDAHRHSAERLSLKSGPIISANGLLVAVPLLEGHGALVFRLPAHGERKRSKPKRQQWSSSCDMLSAAFSGKTLGVVLSSPQKLHFWQMAALGEQARPPREEFEAPPGRGSLLPCVWQRDGAHTRLHVLDAARRLVYWVSSHAVHNPGRTSRGPMLLDTEVVAMASVNDHRIVYVCRDDQQLWIRFAGATGREKRSYRLGHGFAVAPAVFLAGGARWNTHFGGCAVRMSDAGAQEPWRVHEESSSPEHPHVDWEARIAPGARVAGLIQQAHPGGYALVVQAANRSDFTLHSKHGVEALYSAPAAVERVSVCPRSGVIAMLTRERELHVYSTADKSIRLVIHSGANPPAADEAA